MTFWSTSATAASAVVLVASADIILDCTDNFATRHAINRACVHHKKPLVSGAAIRFDGQVSVYDLRRDDSPCYHCLFPEGDATGNRPGMFDMVGRAKYDAWAALQGTPRESAMRDYIALVESLK